MTVSIETNRIEITSAGVLPEGLSEREFFEGYSVPRNKELMRVFKDVDLVEQLGSGIPRILETYGKECFQFSANFLRMVFLSVEPVNVTDQVKALLSVMVNAHNRNELMNLLKLSHNHTFRKNYLHSAMKIGLIELTLPDKPKSSKQQYRITEKGRPLKRRMQ